MSDDVWRRIWEERGRDYPEDDPALIAGYDQVFSRLSPETLGELAADLATKLELGGADVLLDVGCGAGLLLSRLAPRVAKAWGTDLAASLVDRTRSLFPELQVRQAEAEALPFESGSFDKVLLHGVVQYFPDQAYAARALDEALRVCKPRCRILVGDVMDATRREVYLETRARLAASAVPRWTSSVKESPAHLYLTREFFQVFAADRGIRCVALDRHVEGYINARFRFDVLLSREARDVTRQSGT